MEERRSSREPVQNVIDEISEARPGRRGIVNCLTTLLSAAQEENLDPFSIRSSPSDGSGVQMFECKTGLNIHSADESISHLRKV